VPAATIEIGADAAFCWTLLADPRLVPDWIPAVAQVEVLEHDAGGRAVRVQYVGMPSTGSIDYQLSYRYDEAARRMTWTPAGVAERELDGAAWIEALAGGRCRLHYELVTRTGRGLPQWARDTLADDTADKVVRAFQRFAERRAGAAT
jgi:carbon monoxide dehydrogenase subunit G